MNLYSQLGVISQTTRIITPDKKTSYGTLQIRIQILTATSFVLLIMYVWIILSYLRTITDRQKRVAPFIVNKCSVLLEKLESNKRGSGTGCYLKISDETPTFGMFHF